MVFPVLSADLRNLSQDVYLQIENDVLKFAI